MQGSTLTYGGEKERNCRSCMVKVALNMVKGEHICAFLTRGRGTQEFVKESIMGTEFARDAKGSPYGHK